MASMTKTEIFILLILIIAPALMIGGQLYAQCYGPLNIDPEIIRYDYIVRLAVHFGDEAMIPEDIVCSTSMTAGESPIEVPIYFYNGHEGVMRLYFSVESCDSIASFSPQSGFNIISQSKEKVSGVYRMSLKVDAGMPVCGPALIGYAYIIPSGRYDPIWIAFNKNSAYDRMAAIDIRGGEHHLFSPHYGGYVGTSYMYTCQDPICEEPNMAVMDFEARRGYGNSAMLTWMAGSGDHTMIRYSLDHFPQGYDDGELVITMESLPGQEQYYFHTNPPLGTVLYYTAFSITEGPGDKILRSSFVECEATDTTMVEYQIDVERTSWGALKGMNNSQ